MATNDQITQMQGHELEAHIQHLRTEQDKLREELLFAVGESDRRLEADRAAEKVALMSDVEKEAISEAVKKSGNAPQKFTVGGIEAGPTPGDPGN